jgi:hypothetical protein
MNDKFDVQLEYAVDAYVRLIAAQNRVETLTEVLHRQVAQLNTTQLKAYVERTEGANK